MAAARALGLAQNDKGRSGIAAPPSILAANFAYSQISGRRQT
jgi:hypothetical protein